LIEGGAQAISISAPRGALTPNPSPAGGGGLVTGRLYGPSLFPRALEAVYSAAKLGLPIIGAGGVWTKENAQAMLSAGALGVQVDAVLWGVNWLSQSSME
jgi:dihydroorotate dehydrogenase